MLRRRRPTDPLDEVVTDSLDARWRAPVEAALDARARYRALVARATAGPVRDRLDALGVRVDAAVLAAWHAARRAQDLAAAVATLDPGRLTDELKQARRRLAEVGGADPTAATLVEHLAAQHATAHRLWNELDEADDTLRLVEVRLGALVARAAELAFRAGPTAELEAAGAELDGLVGELGQVRRALDELDAGGA